MKLDSLALKLGFEKKSGGFSRSFHGYEVNLVGYKFPGAYVQLPMLMFVLDHALTTEDIKSLKKIVGLTRFVKESAGLKNNAFLVNGRFKNQEKLEERLAKITEKLSELNLKSLTHCPYCGEEDTDSVRIIKGATIHVHNACVEKFVEQVTTHINTVSHSKEHLAKSIIFALIGGFIGLIPSIILLAFAGIYSAWLFLLIPFAAFYGFKKGGAQKGAYVMPIVAIISVIMAPGFMFYAYYDFAMYNGITFSALLSDPDMMTAFTSDMVMSVLFIALALWVSWSKIYKQTLGQVKKDMQDLQR